MSNPSGGPAFPSKIENYSEKEMAGFNGEPIKQKTFSSYPGMTLRDYFAAKAMQAMIATAGAPCLFGLEGCEANTAAGAYKVADAMLAERAK